MSQDPLQNLSKRKHRHSPRSNSYSEDDAAHGSPKRQKLRHSTVPPSSFWDGLSEVPLCKSALRELDRRNRRRELGQTDATYSSKPTLRRSRRLQIRRAAADARDLRQRANRRLGSPTFQNIIKRIAKDGGFDHTDLRGVNSSHNVPSAKLTGNSVVHPPRR